MKVIWAIIMGLVQGATEFLPVSSSGHLAIVKALFGMEDQSILFDVLLHVATLVSICIVFYRDILRLILEFIGIIKDLFTNLVIFGRSVGGNNEKPEYTEIISNPYRRFVLLIIISTIPTGIIGILMDDVVEYAETNLLLSGICLLGTAAILFISDYLPNRGKRIKEANYGDAFVVGLAQGVATLPGISRSGSTITAGLLCGFDRKFAAKYSFIMSMPAILGALILELKDISSESITGSDVGCYILGMVIAGVLGYFALKFTMNLLARKVFKYCSLYCVGAGILSIVIYLIKLK